MGSTTTAASTKATAPAKRLRALTRRSAACASLDTEGRTLPGGLRGAALSFLENSPIDSNTLTQKKDRPEKRLTTAKSVYADLPLACSAPATVRNDPNTMILSSGLLSLWAAARASATEGKWLIETSASPLV